MIPFSLFFLALLIAAFLIKIQKELNRRDLELKSHLEEISQNLETLNSSFLNMDQRQADLITSIADAWNEEMKQKRQAAESLSPSSRKRGPFSEEHKRKLSESAKERARKKRESLEKLSTLNNFTKADPHDISLLAAEITQ